MTIAEMFGQSTIVTLLGMGIVFGFLIVMIIVITFVGKIIHALGLDKDLQAPVQAKSSVPAPSAGPAHNAVITAVISAAITEYCKTHSYPASSFGPGDNMVVTAVIWTAVTEYRKTHS